MTHARRLAPALLLAAGLLACSSQTADSKAEPQPDTGRPEQAFPVVNQVNPDRVDQFGEIITYGPDMTAEDQAIVENLQDQYRIPAGTAYPTPTMTVQWHTVDLADAFAFDASCLWSREVLTAAGSHDPPRLQEASRGLGELADQTDNRLFRELAEHLAAGGYARLRGHVDTNCPGV